MSYLIVANAAAGSTDGVEASARVFEEVDGCDIAWTASDGDVDRILTGDDRTLVIAGGDGSIHMIVNRLGATGHLERPVGILPMGTGNDLARGLELPFDPEEGARRILNGEPRRLPLMTAPNGELAVNNAHTGLGVAAARRGTEWKERLGSFAYSAASVVEGLGFEGVEVRVGADGRLVHEGRCLTLLVLIGPSAGGGFRPLPDVSVDEPVLEVLVVADGTLGEKAGVAISALRGDLDDHEGVVRVSAQRVEVETGGSEWELDGEFRTWSDPIELGLDDRTWNVIC